MGSVVPQRAPPTTRLSWGCGPSRWNRHISRRKRLYIRTGCKLDECLIRKGYICGIIDGAFGGGIGHPIVRTDRSWCHNQRHGRDMNVSEEHSFAGQGQISIRSASASYSVAPGSSVTIPIFLHNQSHKEGSFELSVTGIPSPWVFIPSPVVRLAPGEQREVPLTIQAPALPQGRAGRHRLVVRAANQAAPADADDVRCTLTVATLEVPGRIGLLLAATEFPVVPGKESPSPWSCSTRAWRGTSLAWRWTASRPLGSLRPRHPHRYPRVSSRKSR
jgi:hypothetical protein